MSRFTGEEKRKEEGEGEEEEEGAALTLQNPRLTHHSTLTREEKPILT